jgi:capsular polysaccharide biosynthesis protein
MLAPAGSSDPANVRAGPNAGVEARDRSGRHLPDTMRAFTLGRPPLSRADLEPVLRLAMIPLIGALCGLILAEVYSLAQSTQYESRSQVVVSPASGFVDPARTDAFARISSTVQQIGLTQKVLGDAVDRLAAAGVRGNRTAGTLRGRLRLTISGDTPLLTIAAVDGNQAVASAISTAETDALVNAVNTASTDAVTTSGTTTTTTTQTPKKKTTTTTSASGTIAGASGLRLDVFSKGEPQGKVQPRAARNILLGTSAGLIIGCFVLAQMLSRESRRRSA